MLAVNLHAPFPPAQCTRFHAGTRGRPDLAHLPGRRAHRRHHRPASCGVQGRAARTDPLPGLPARRQPGPRSTRWPRRWPAETRMLPGDPAQLRGRCPSAARPAIPGHQPRRGHPRQGLPRPARSSPSMAASTPTGTGRHSPRRADVLAGLPPTSALAAVPALRDRHVLRERSCAARQRLFSERLRSGHR